MYGSRTRYPARKASSLISSACALLHEEARRQGEDEELRDLARQLADLAAELRTALRRKAL